MTDLTALRSEAVPRAEDLCRRLGGRVAPWWSFIVHSAGWLLLGGLGAAAGLSLYQKVGWPAAYGLAVLALLLGAAGFARFVLRRRAAARRLIRDGKLHDAEVKGMRRFAIKGHPRTVAILAFDAEGPRKIQVFHRGHPAELEQGARVPVLYLPGSRYCVAFPVGETMVQGSPVEDKA